MPHLRQRAIVESAAGAAAGTSEEREETGPQTVGSDPTSWVTPAVSPAALFRTCRNTQLEVASSVYWHVRQVNMSLCESSSSFGYSMFEHSEQKRKVICSRLLLLEASPDVVDCGVAMVGWEESGEWRCLGLMREV